MQYCIKRNAVYEHNKMDLYQNLSAVELKHDKMDLY